MALSRYTSLMIGGLQQGSPLASRAELDFVDQRLDCSRHRSEVAYKMTHLHRSRLVCFALRVLEPHGLANQLSSRIMFPPVGISVAI